MLFYRRFRFWQVQGELFLATIVSVRISRFVRKPRSAFNVMGVLGLRYAILILLVLAGASLVLHLLGGSSVEPSNVTSFEQCEAAGYPILESYPRQCKTPEGKTFTSLTDLFYSTINVNCSQDSDCVLANKEQGFGCCSAGACEEIDYSQEKWVAVNGNWLEENRTKYCPSKEECGPAPGCATRMTNNNFEAKCLVDICQKVAK